MTDSRVDAASIAIRRRIEWIDTDAAGIYHWTTACRMTEAAEAELHRSLGITELTFGFSPRVSVHFDFHRRLRFDDLVEVELEVDRVDRSSIAYAVVITGPDGVAVTGRIVTCLVDPESGEAVAVEGRLRELLTEGGRQAADTETSNN